MSTRGNDELDDARMERLLSGGTNRSVDTDAVASVLAAASAPPVEEELVGERAVMVAFARANEDRGRHPLLARLGKLLASKAAAVVLVTSAAGGAAFAAGGGIPNPFNGPGAGVTPTDPTTSRPAERPSGGGEGRTDDDAPTTRRAEVDATTAPPTAEAPNRQPDAQPTSEPTPGPAPTGEPTDDPVPTPPRTPIPTPTSPTEPPPIDPTELPVPTPDLPTMPAPQPQPEPADLPDGIRRSPADQLGE